MEPHERLQKARIEAGFESLKAAADRYGWNEHTYKSHENGVRGLKLPIARKYANAFKVSAAYLLTGNQDAPNINAGVVSIPVFADAAGGRWLEDEGGEMSDAAKIPAVASSEYPSEGQYARKVQGSSVSNQIRSGEYAIMIKREYFPGAIPNNKLVDVKRTGGDGLVENSIKVFRDNKLYTDSSELESQEELHMDNGQDGTVVSITGVVIAAHRPLY